MAKKKRFHQSSTDRFREHAGMERKLHGYFGGDYAGYDVRREQEYRDGEMIAEDHTAIANLPQQVIMREYPRTPYMTFELNDSITGVDELMRKNSKQQKHGRTPAEKYETK